MKSVHRPWLGRVEDDMMIRTGEEKGRKEGKEKKKREAIYAGRLQQDFREFDSAFVG